MLNRGLLLRLENQPTLKFINLVGIKSIACLKRKVFCRYSVRLNKDARLQRTISIILLTFYGLNFLDL